MSVKYLIFGLSILLGAQNTFAETTIGVFDSGEGSTHQAKVKEVLVSNLNCRCKIRFYPIYDHAGRLFEESFLSAVDQAVKDEVKIFHFSWNLASSAKTRKIESKVAEIIKLRRLVVAAAGRNSKKTRVPAKLSQTVMGRVPGVFIIGELTQKGRLEPRSNYGPEMYKAIMPPKGYVGSSFSAALFTAKYSSKMVP